MQVIKIFIKDIIDKQEQKYLFLNTNSWLDNDNKAFLVGSVYSILRKKQPELSSLYGKILKAKKFGVQYICDIDQNHLYSFPTRYHFKDMTNLKLFQRSRAEIKYMIQNKTLKDEIPIYIPLILENTKFKINFDDLVDSAKLFLDDQKKVFLIPCWGYFK